MVHIEVFGATQVRDRETGVTVRDLGGVKPRQILEILALSAGSPVTKDRLADLLWHGEPPRSYLGTLESYVCVLRRRLGLSGGRASVLRTTPYGYLLESSAVSVDILEARAVMGRALTAPPAVAVRLVEELLESIGGELLADEPYAAWATQERESFAQAVAACCTRTATVALADRDLESAARMAEAAIRYDPLAELALQTLMRALWGLGRRCEALRAFFSLRSFMLAELGMEPGPATRALYLEILCDEPVASADRDATDRLEVRAILGLLRQALERMPGVRVPDDDRALAQTAASVLQTA